MNNFKWFCSLLLYIVIMVPGTAQKKAKLFPGDFTGIFSGQLNIKNAGQNPISIPMEFHLLETDTADRFEYRLIYDGQPRNYALVIEDIASGSFHVDENNGIILPSKLIENVLYSFFEVEKKLLSSRIAFYQDYLEFEILFSDISAKSRTGENTDYEIYGYPITTTQTAILTRQ